MEGRGEGRGERGVTHGHATRVKRHLRPGWVETVEKDPSLADHLHKLAWCTCTSKDAQDLDRPRLWVQLASWKGRQLAEESSLRTDLA